MVDLPNCLRGMQAGRYKDGALDTPVLLLAADRLEMLQNEKEYLLGVAAEAKAECRELRSELYAK